MAATLSNSRLKSRIIVATAALSTAVFGSTSLHATVYSWLGATSTDWNNSSNWIPAGFPNSTADRVDFVDFGGGTVNISSSVSILDMTFSTTTSSYTVTSSANQTLTLASGNVTDNSTTANDTLNLANIATGSLLYSGNLTLTNNSLSGSILDIGSNTVIGSPGIGGLAIQGIGQVNFDGSFATGANAVVGGIIKNGPGLFHYFGNGTNLKGNFNFNGGTTILDFQFNTVKMATAANGGNTAIILGGDTLQVESLGAVTQVIPGGLVIGQGQSTYTNIGSASVTLSATSISHGVGGTIDFNTNSTTLFSTSMTNTSGILGAYATANNGAGWAAIVSGNVSALPTYSTNAYLSGANTDVTTNATLAGITTNSLRFNTSGVTLTLSGANVIQSGGILATTASSGSTLPGGTISATGGGEMIVQAYGNITINSSIVANTLTKGGTGYLILSGSNPSLTGPINVNQGYLEVTNVAAVGAATTINFNNNRFGVNLAQFVVDLGNNNSGTISAPIRLSTTGLSDYGTYFIPGFFTSGANVTLSGVISSNPAATGGNTSIRITNSGGSTSGFNFTNTANTFAGNISLSNGFLGITADGSLGDPSNTLVLEDNNNVTGGLIFLNSGINVAHPIVFNSAGRIVSNGTDSNTISSVITGTGGFAKDGTGTLTLTAANTVSGNFIVFGGTLSLGSSGFLGSNSNVLVNATGTFIPNSASSIFPHYGNITLNGGTLRENTGSGNIFINTLSIVSGGNIDLTGTTAFAIKVQGTGDAITVGSNATWISPNNASTIINFGGTVIPITISPGVTLTNGIALSQSFMGFQILGGGTLYQNSDATNQLAMNANITVTQGTFRITDASGNTGVGDFGTALFTLDGGTFSYGGTTATTNKSIELTSNGGTINVESAAATLTLTNSIDGFAPLIKSGPGTLNLSFTINSSSSLTINGGTVSTNTDAALGFGPVTVSNAASILFTATTSSSRTFNLNSGSLLVSSGAVLTLNAATVNGGTMRGSGSFTLTGGSVLNSVTTFSNVLINQTGTAAFTAFTNGGTINNSAPLTLIDGTNNFTGTLNISSAVTAQDFGSTGVINITAGGSITNSGSNLTLGGGSRTFIGTQANPGGSITLQGGTTLEVNGALLVNDGTITGTTDVNFGSQAQGLGTYGLVNVSFGGVFQPGFASFALAGNGASVTGLSGNGTVDNQTAGGNMNLVVSGSGSSTFAGTIQNTTGTLSLSIQGTSSLTLSSSPLPSGGNSTNTYSGGTSISSGGALIIAAPGALPAGFPVANSGSFTVNANSTSGRITGTGSIHVGPGATLKIAAGNAVSSNDFLTLAGVSNGWTGGVDLTSNKLILEDASANRSADLATLKNQALPANIHNNTVGIFSSTAPVGQILVVSDNAIRMASFAQGSTNFGGGTNNVDANSILITSAIPGDYNLDGVVDLKDLQDIANHWQQTVVDWSQGDVDGNGKVELQDLQAVANHWQAGVGSGSGSGQSFADALALIGNFTTPASTPEPTSLAILAVGGLLVTRRRRVF